MAKKGLVSKIISFVAWLTGVLVSLAVGFGMINRGLVIPWLDDIGASIVTIYAGWIVVILAVVGVILALINNR